MSLVFNRSTFKCGKASLAVLIVLVVLTPSCGSSGQLDRKKAAALIGASPNFRQIYYVIVAHRSNKRYLDPEDAPADERGEAAAVANFFNSNPYRAVLKELGLVNVRARYIGVENGRNVFALDIGLTDAGRKLWQDVGAQVDESAVPLAKRELLEITGVKGGDAQSKRAEAEFTWRWVPTIAGKAMMKGTPEFENLPAKIKEQFGEKGVTVFGIGSHPPLDLDGTRRANAQFQLYDDGWRLTDIRPMDTRPLNPID